MSFVLGDIQPIKLGAGVVRYRCNDRIRQIDVAEATVYDKIVVVFHNDGTLEKTRLSFPLSSLIDHQAR